MLLITCFIFGLLGSLTWAGPHGRTVCPSGTFANRDRSQWYCYKFYEDGATFQEAEEECQYKWRGHLASFTRDKQVETIGAYLSKENTENNYVWIGLQRENMHTAWRWTDGSRSRYKKFNSAESKASYNKNCVAFSPVYDVDISMATQLNQGGSEWHTAAKVNSQPKTSIVFHFKK